ncbi:Alpha/beta-hydrolase [Mycena venus]|uniref:Alpha/beta-hydrolase n=1 Tax=Mycena venus TaxID=2733690 RepID=A0A8H7D6H5_9AGAR|nr:Alpha/beta-hydrolase [Mycena venus]
MYDDAAAVAALVSSLTDEDQDVVLVAHSYGGIVACEAAKGLAKTVRVKEGKAGGVVRIVFVTAVVANEGQSLKDVFDATERLDFIRVEGEYMALDPAGCAPVNYSDLPPIEALSWASRMREHAAGSFLQNVTYAAYKDIPVSYLVCEEDKVVPSELQNRYIAKMESEMGEKRVDRHPVRAGHCINASQPETVATVIRRALGEKI